MDLIFKCGTQTSFRNICYSLKNYEGQKVSNKTFNVLIGDPYALNFVNTRYLPHYSTIFYWFDYPGLEKFDKSSPMSMKFRLGKGIRAFLIPASKYNYYAWRQYYGKKVLDYVPRCIPQKLIDKFYTPLDQKHDYILIIGTQAIRKNIELIIPFLPKDYKFVLISPVQIYTPLPPNVKMMKAHSMKYETVLRYIANARAVIFVPKAEGFGMPTLEAWALGTPSIYSDIPALKDHSYGIMLKTYYCGGYNYCIFPQDITDAVEKVLDIKSVPRLPDEFICSNALKKLNEIIFHSTGSELRVR